jgi:mRNA interferase MazF
MDLDAAGLPSASVVRMKLFTLDDQLVVKKAGVLAAADRGRVVASLRRLLNLKA